MEIVQRMRRQLVQAMKDGDPSAVDALRSAMAALANAEAVPVADGPYDPAEGPYGGEAARRELTATDVRTVLDGLVAELHESAALYREHGQGDAAEDLARQSAVLEAYVVAEDVR
jgi:uncharacterized protein YqeY